MKYILNTGRYDRAYEIERGNQKILIALSRRRVYMDTGNVAISGITPVEDDDYALLEKNRAFVRDLASKDESMGLSLVDESVALGEPDERTAQLEKENKELKEALAKAKKPEVKKLEEENKTLADENADLKAQLEALTKGKATKPAEDTKEADGKDGEKADEKVDEGF